MASDTLGHVPLSKRRAVRLDKQTKILLGLAFLAAIMVFRMVHTIQRWTSLGPLMSALDGYQRMCVPFLSVSEFADLGLRVRNSQPSLSSGKT